MSSTRTVFISAAEASADLHGAGLVRALKRLGQQEGVALRFWGVGGPALQAEGVECIEDARELSVMGSTEVLGKVPRVWRLLRRIEHEARSVRQTDLAVVIDSPDLSLRIAERLTSQGIPVVDFIPPKIWVWRKRRAEKLKRLFKKVLCIFPFEEVFFRDLGVPAQYVGNPLKEELRHAWTRERAREALGVSTQARFVWCVMPGSREAEITQHLDLFSRSIVECWVRCGRPPGWEVLVPLPKALETAAFVDWEKFKIPREILVRRVFGDSDLCLLAADAGLIKSGTSTLEAALLECPQVVAYKPGRVSQFIYNHVVSKIFRGPVGLVNLALGWKPGDPLRAREFLCENATVEKIASELVHLAQDRSYRQTQIEAVQDLKQAFLRTEQSASERAAKEVWACF